MLISYIIQDFMKRVKKLITTQINSLKVERVCFTSTFSLQPKHLRVTKTKRIAAS